MSDMPQSSAQQAAGLGQVVTSETPAVSSQLGGPIMQNKVVAVRWNASEPPAEGMTLLTGMVTVAVALSGRFNMFIVAGIAFNIAGATVGATAVPFSYSGTRSASAIRDLLTPGATIALVAN